MRKKKALKSKGFPVKNKAEQNCHVPPPIRHPPPGQFPLCPFPRSVAILAWRAAMVCSAPNSTTRRALRQLLPTLLKNLLHHRPLPPPPRRPFLSSSVTAPLAFLLLLCRLFLCPLGLLPPLLLLLLLCGPLRPPSSSSGCWESFES